MASTRPDRVRARAASGPALRSALCHQGIGEIVVQPGEVGLERERTPIVAYRLVQTAERRERIGEIIAASALGSSPITRW